MQDVIYTFTGSFLAMVFVFIAVVVFICVMVYWEVGYAFRKTPLDARKGIEKLYNRVCGRYGYAFDVGPAESYEVTEGIVRKELGDYLDEMQELLKSYFPARKEE